MNSYSYIQEFFRAILIQSKQIQGRFYILPKYGQEINSDSIGQLVAEVAQGAQYPLVAMMPPKSVGYFSTNNEWEDYFFELFFLTTTYYTGNNEITDLNETTNTSSRSVIDEWETMKLAAVDFIRVLRLVQKGANTESLNMLNNIFRLPNDKLPITPVSFQTSNRLSGVRISFKASLFLGCDITDYNSGALITLPPQQESQFQAQLAIVRSEVQSILNSLGLGDGNTNTIDGGLIF